jgi:hypothetical protein
MAAVKSTSVRIEELEDWAWGPNKDDGVNKSIIQLMEMRGDIKLVKGLTITIFGGAAIWFITQLPGWLAHLSAGQ